MTLPRVSIITVCYNAAATIADTIASVAAQKGVTIEHIIVDGGSDDGTQAIVQQHISSVEQFVSEPDDGLYDAMNKGARIANGSYISFLNASDIYFKEAIKSVAENIEKHHFDYCVAPVVIRDENNQDIRISRPLNNFIYQKGKLMEMYAPHLSVFTRTTLFNDLNGYDLQFKYSSDYDFLLRLADTTKNIFYGDDPIGAFKLGGISGSYSTHLENFKVGLKHGVPMLSMIAYTTRYIFRSLIKSILPIVIYIITLI